MSVLSHADNNDLQLADEDLTKLLLDLKAQGKLENTLVLVMADHGHRFIRTSNRVLARCAFNGLVYW